MHTGRVLKAEESEKDPYKGLRESESNRKPRSFPY